MHDDYLEFWDEDGVGHQVARAEFLRRQHNESRLAQRIQRLDVLEAKFAINAWAWFIGMVVSNLIPIISPMIYNGVAASGYLDEYMLIFALWFWGSIGWYVGFRVTRSMVNRTIAGDRVPNGQFMVAGTMMGMVVAYLYEVGLSIGS